MGRSRKKANVASTREEIAEVCVELQRIQRQRVIVMKSAQMQKSRIQAIVAGTLGYSNAAPEAERAKKFDEAATLIKSVINDGASHGNMTDIIKTTYIGIKALEDLQDEIEKSALTQVKVLPVKDWVEAEDQRGFGLKMLAVLIGETGDLFNYPSPRRVYSRMGCQPYSFGDQTLMGASWRSKQYGSLPSSEWEQFGYSPRRRSVAYLVGEGLMKLNFKTNKETGQYSWCGPYRRRYDEAKELAWKNHQDWRWFEHKPCGGKGCDACDHRGATCARAHLHGMLLATKRLFKNLWRVWNGQPPEH